MSTYKELVDAIEADMTNEERYILASEAHEFSDDHLNYCPECGDEVERAGAGEDDYDEHTFNANGVLVIGCQGYWVHDPALFSLPRGQWSDWNGVTPM